MKKGEERSPYREVAALGAVLLIYVIVLELPLFQAIGETVHMFITNTWLLLGSCVYVMRVPMQVVRIKNYRPLIFSLAVLCVLLLVQFALVPASPGEAQIRRWPLVLLVVLVPFAEEIYFRGLLLDHIATHVNKVAAVILVSVLFGLLHFPQGHGVLLGVCSIGLCVLTLRTQQVAWAIVLHGIWNLLSVHS
ncbi:MAG TPA: CPBP family intramembrane metalloprotease [Candidatus Hydrogenedentes bacterium]|nr:CPBP family intramembrane metalloprotease [Candidatus Hydrogenedentota bacterium]